MKTEIIGVRTKMQTFSFFYELYLTIVAHSHSVHLSSSLQGAELCAVDDQKKAKLSGTVLQVKQSDRNAGLDWTKVTQAAVKFRVTSTFTSISL